MNVRTLFAGEGRARRPWIIEIGKKKDPSKQFEINYVQSRRPTWMNGSQREGPRLS